MQNRSKHPLLKFAPIPLQANFPLRISEPFAQSDRPIEFLHAHDCLELGFCHEGSGIFMVGSKVLPYRGGEGIFIGPAEPHLAQSSPGTKSHWRWIWLDPTRLLDERASRWAELALLAGPHFQNVLSPSVAPIVRQIVEEHDIAAPGWQDMCRALVWRLMIEVRRSASVQPSHEFAGLATDAYARLAPALHRMSRDHAEPLRMGDMARSCGLSEAQFRRIFQATLGRSPHEYLTDMRLRMAATLLSQPGRTILQVSSAVGFTTLSSFNRAWKRVHGKSPREWRAITKLSKIEQLGARQVCGILDREPTARKSKPIGVSTYLKTSIIARNTP